MAAFPWRPQLKQTPNTKAPWQFFTKQQKVTLKNWPRYFDFFSLLALCLRAPSNTYSEMIKGF
jgi:hypothetical protein